MSQPSIYPALYVKPPDVINALQQYATVGQTDANTAKLQAETVTERERPALTQAQTAKTQIENELAKINLGVAQYGLGMIQGGGNQGNEPLPGGAGSEGSSYGNVQPDADPARWATATPPPTTGQQAVVDAAANKYGVPKELAYWVGTHESGWNRDAVGPETSSGRARGAWQFMDSTAKDYGLADPTDFATSTDAAMHKLSDLYKKTGDWGEAVRQYGTFSTGRGAGRDAAVHAGFDQYAAQHGFGKQVALTARDGQTQVAAAGNGPASWGVGGGQPGAAPPAPGGGGTPNALAVANPMGTSSQGIMMPGLGVALPRYQALSVITATDKIGALDKVMTQRRMVLTNLAAQATDAASWNNNVAQAWRMGYLTNAEFQQFYGHYSPGLQQWVIRSLAPAEAQLGDTREWGGRGFTPSPNGPQFTPPLMQGKEPVKIDVPVYDDKGNVIGTRPQTYSAPAFHAGPGAPGAGAPAAPPPAPAPTPAPAPAPAPAAAPPPAPGAPTPTVSGVGAETPRPVQGAGPAAPTAPAVNGTVTAPAPAGNAPVTPPGAGQGPIVPPGAGGMAPGAIGAGPITLTPDATKQLEVQTEQKKAQIAAVGDRVKQDATTINEAQTGAMHSQSAIPTVLDLRNRVAAMPASAFGAWGQERSVMDNILQTVAPDQFNKWTAYLSGHKIDPNNAGQLQAARKEFFQLVTSAESQLPGTRIGARLTSYFADAMPSLNMQKPAVQEMLNFLLVGNQLAIDYAQGMAKHYNANFASYSANGSYAPIAQFDQEWTKAGSAHAPGVYEAAARILNGSVVGQWDKGLTADQQAEALSIVTRADPAYHFHTGQLPGLPKAASK